jgi:hypothetical protein
MVTRVRANRELNRTREDQWLPRPLKCRPLSEAALTTVALGGGCDEYQLVAGDAARDLLPQAKRLLMGAIVACRGAAGAFAYRTTQRPRPSIGRTGGPATREVGNTTLRDPKCDLPHASASERRVG